jgi:uncharacterized damage-inducible protein DinB
MSNTLQEFLAGSIPKAMEDLEAALLRLPEDKRGWCPMGKARTALDQAAECALLNGSTADLIKTKTWSMGSDFSEYESQKAALREDWTAVQALLHENTAKVAEAVRGVPDEDLDIEIDMPWGPMTMAKVMAYPYWNMCYHEGQINYIASMLGCLD